MKGLKKEKKRKILLNMLKIKESNQRPSLPIRDSQVTLVVKNPPANAGDVRDTASIPWLERSPGGGHGNPLQHSCLENPMNRGASQATVHSITESDMTEPT